MAIICKGLILFFTGGTSCLALSLIKTVRTDMGIIYHYRLSISYY